jgi:hypothetical protein
MLQISLVGNNTPIHVAGLTVLIGGSPEVYEVIEHKPDLH